MVSYNPSVIVTRAASLYSQANWVIAVYMCVGAAIFGVIGYLPLHSANWATLGALAGAVIGFLLAYPKAFLLKLQAQLALCQVEIEKNTRSPKA